MMKVVAAVAAAATAAAVASMTMSARVSSAARRPECRARVRGTFVVFVVSVSTFFARSNARNLTENEVNMKIFIVNKHDAMLEMSRARARASECKRVERLKRICRRRLRFGIWRYEARRRHQAPRRRVVASSRRRRSPSSTTTAATAVTTTRCWPMLVGLSACRTEAFDRGNARTRARARPIRQRAIVYDDDDGDNDGGGDQATS